METPTTEVHHPPSCGPRPCSAPGNPNTLERKRLGDKLDHYAIIKFPLLTESKEDRRKHTCAHCVSQGQQAAYGTGCKQAYDTAVDKVNTLIRPDRGKEACVWLAPDYDALDVAIGII
ncbi:60S ribosomal protein L23a [Cricetulus griseus]|uniref:60S ribosomal protein L23a n=1 Tax=Cricetulus griseus TaxID=10029 RepID=G3HP94_CRIGR|nr:60S ribosomal protein L23a [Cricetulus griseus]